MNLRSRFDSRQSICATLTEIDLVRRFAFKSHVWSVRIVPLTPIRDFLAETGLVYWYENAPHTFILHRKMESLDAGYGAVLADGTETRLDIFVFAPIESFRAIKLRAVIEDDVSGVCSFFKYDTIHCCNNIGSSWVLCEGDASHQVAQKMIYHVEGMKASERP